MKAGLPRSGKKVCKMIFFQVREKLGKFDICLEKDSVNKAYFVTQPNILINSHKYMGLMYAEY